MADYIERQVAIEKLQNNIIYMQTFGVDRAVTLIDEVPSADVVEVVRCKDCKYQDKGQNEVESWNVCNYRPWLYVNTYDDHFCSDGERKDG